MESWTSNMTRCRHSLFVATFLTVFPLVVPKAIVREDPDIEVVSVGNGIRLHYVERGHGEPVIFVHGSLGDGSYRCGPSDVAATTRRLQKRRARFLAWRSATRLAGLSPL